MAVIAVIGDTHIGGSTALCTPQYEIHTARPSEVQVCQASKAQGWLWQNWQDITKYAKSLCMTGRRKTKRLIVIHTGDVMDGNHHGTSQIMPEIADQIKVALDILQPLAEGADAMYGTLGTEVHAGNNNDTEHGIYRALGIPYDYQHTLDIDGCLLDVAHHSPLATLPAMYKILADYNGRRPRYIIRGHRHRVSDTGEEDPHTRMIVIGSWQLKTSYAWRVDQLRRSDIGGLIINDGVIDASRLRYYAQPDERKIVKV